MKLYKLRFTRNDFVSKLDNVWRTDVIDLYDNDQYRNYSARRASQGSNLLGNGVYTGLNAIDSTTSDIGFVEDGRFVDTSGEVDIIGWDIKMADDALLDKDVKLNIYATEEEGLNPYYEHATPDLISDWAKNIGLVPGQAAYEFNSKRYCFFEIDFPEDSIITTDFNIELIISVEIQPPVVDGFFPATRKALDRFPEWMEMREYDPEDINDLEKATPTKLGSLFINSIAGEWLADLRGKITYQEFQKHIENVDISQKSWAWRTSNVPDDIFSIEYDDGGTYKQLTYTTSLNEFYASEVEDKAFFYNRVSKEVYTLEKFAELRINGTEYVQDLYQVWNAIDDLGVNVDLFRMRGETNDSFRKRILDVYRSKPGVSADRFKKSLRRELNLWRYFSATPDSDYLGATPEVLSIEDIENDDKYFGPDGNAKEAFFDFVSELGKKYPMTWGLFRYGEAFWDNDGLYHKGSKTIPKQFDAATPDLEKYQSGVGDINDLYVLPPDFYKEEQGFDTTLAVRGKRPTVVDQYTEINFQVEVTGLSNRTIATYDSVPRSFYIEIVSDGTTLITNLTLNSSYYAGDAGDIGLENYSPSTTWPPPQVVPEAKTLSEWVTADGVTAAHLLWYDKSDGNSILGQVDASSITNVKVYPGSWVPATQSTLLVPDSDFYVLKFADSSLTANLGHNGSASISDPSPDFASKDYRIQYEAWDFEVFSDETEGFESIAQSLDVSVNRGDVLAPDTINVGNFSWPVYNSTGTEVQKIRVKLSETNESGDYGFFTRNGTFIPASDLTFNGDSNWVDGSITMELGSPIGAGDTTPLVFACSASVDYPEQVPSWEMLYATADVPLTNQKVNEHGAYRFGLAPKAGSASTIIETLNLSYSDFSLLTGDVITWIGIDSISNDNVLVWTETNSVVPDGEDPTKYPEGALVEDAGSFGTLNVHAKIKPEVNPSWEPFFHSGWFYEDKESYYLYADHQSATVSTGVSNITLGSQPSQGAPVIVYNSDNEEIREVPFSEDLFAIEEIKNGTGTDSLFAGYNNIANIEVWDVTSDVSVGVTSETSADNEIKTGEDTLRDHKYKITYTLKDSFVVNNLATPGFSEVIFSDPPSSSQHYTINWEGSSINPARRLEAPLHPVYSSMTEGFLYIDHDEQDLSYAEANISPSHILATPGDYALVTLNAYDKYGNPKPNTTFLLFHQDDITLSSHRVVTDATGHAFVYLEASENSTSGVIEAYGFNGPSLFDMDGFWDARLGIEGSGGVGSAQLPKLEIIASNLLSDNPIVVGVDLEYQVRPLQNNKKKLSVVMDSNAIPADGESATALFGYLYDEADNPIAGAEVLWRKARDIKDLLADVATSTSMATPGSDLIAGKVVTNSTGRFTIGPFVSNDYPGYWLVVAESEGAGDITYWYEYLNGTNILDPITMQPFYSTQQATPPYLFEDYYATPAFPVTVDELNYLDTPTGAVPNWLPPSWYPISKYQQYQMGLLGNEHYEIDTSATPPYDDSVES